MTAKELAQRIMAMPEDEQNLPIRFEYNSGDHWRRRIAGDIAGITTCSTKWSDYHSKMVVDDSEDESDEDRAADSILLTSHKGEYGQGRAGDV